MAAWFNLALNLIPDIIKLASPLFTRSKPQDDVPDVVATQITELQNAAAQNAESIKTLATEMQKTIDVLQLGAETLTKELKVAKTLSLVAVTAAVLAFGLASYALATSS